MFKKNKPFLVLANLFFLFCIALSDYYTGKEYGVFVFYFVPISLLSWYVGIKWGIGFALISAVLWLIVDLILPTHYSSLAAAYWNAFTRLISFLVIAIAISRVARGVEFEKELNVQLHKTVEALTETNQDLHSLTYTIAHDVKNPIRVISAFSDILKEGESKLDSEQNDALSRIISETHRANEIVNDLLRLSKVGSQTLSIADVNLSDIISASVEELRGLYSDVEYEINIQHKMFIHADPGLLRILVDNLIGNALKFTMKSDSPKIWVGMTEQNGENVYYVKDNGAGFEHEKSDKVFEPFIRLHGPKDFPGTGIGLAIVAKIIRRHNGRIWVSSEPGKGTTFYFTLSSQQA